jgi:hypothetical protein
MTELVPTPAGRLKEQPCHHGIKPGGETTSLVALSVAGALSYGLASTLRHHITDIINTREPRYLVLRKRCAPEQHPRPEST